MGADDCEAAPSGPFEEESGLEEEQRPLLKNKRDSNDDDSVITVPPSGFGYNADNRPYRDIAFSIVFLIFVTASLAVGIFAAVNHNPDYNWVESASYDRRQGCALPNEFNAANAIAQGSSWAPRVIFNVTRFLGLDAQSQSLDPFMIIVLCVLVITLILSIPLAFFLLWTLRRFTKELIYITLPAFVILQVAFNVTLFVTCIRSENCNNSFSRTSGLVTIGFLSAMSVLFVWILYKDWDRVQLSIRIIRTASEALHKNFALLLVLPGLDVAYCLYLVPAGLFLFYAYTNGKIITNPELVQSPELGCGGSSDRPCCVWETDAWVPVYLTVTGFVILWGAVIVSEIHIFTISGTVSQWYFAATDSSTVGTTKRSLGQALGPSFGTMCFSGLIIAVVRTIRSAMESSKSNRGEVGCVALLLRACLECLISAVEFLTKFTTDFAAITGEGFCASAVMTFELLKRNFLSTVVVEAIAGRLLSQAVFACAAVYGLLVWGLLALFVKDGKNLWFVAVGATLILLFVLGYFVNVLHNVVDSVYICFAMDKDHNEVSKPDVHEVYVLLPAADDGTASLAVPRPSRKDSKN